MTKQQETLRAYLLRLVRQKNPELCLSGETVTGGTYPTSWASAYAVIGGDLVRLWSPDDMKIRRTDGSYYWHHNGWGTSHRFVLACDVFHAAGLDYAKDHQHVTICWL
jgi:hypothetical protein